MAPRRQTQSSMGINVQEHDGRGDPPLESKGISMLSMCTGQSPHGQDSAGTKSDAAYHCREPRLSGDLAPDAQMYGLLEELRLLQG
eukprot:3316443-Amphidinium_carterae.4